MIQIISTRFSQRRPHLATSFTLLSAEEQARAARFVVESARERFILGRGFLREALAPYTGQPPAALTFTYGARGKPLLAHSPLHFNLAHSGDVLLLALTDVGDIGVDVEQIRPLPHLHTMAHDNFSPAEIAAVLALPHEQQPTAFFTVWTRKEAYIKATGDGFRRPLASFDVSLDDPPRLLRAEGDDPARWTLLHVDPAPGYIGAVCWLAGC